MWNSIKILSCSSTCICYQQFAASSQGTCDASEAVGFNTKQTCLGGCDADCNGNNCADHPDTVYGTLLSLLGPNQEWIVPGSDAAKALQPLCDNVVSDDEYFCPTTAMYTGEFSTTADDHDNPELVSDEENVDDALSPAVLDDDAQTNNDTQQYTYAVFVPGENPTCDPTQTTPANNPDNGQCTNAVRYPHGGQRTADVELGCAFDYQKLNASQKTNTCIDFGFGMNKWNAMKILRCSSTCICFEQFAASSQEDAIACDASKADASMIKQACLGGCDRDCNGDDCATYQTELSGYQTQLSLLGPNQEWIRPGSDEAAAMQPLCDNVVNDDEYFCHTTAMYTGE